MTDYYIKLNDIDIDGDSDNDPIEYHFKIIQNLDDNGEIPATTIEADQPINNVNLGFEGKTRVIPIRWIIYDNGNDKSDNTWSNQVGSSFDSNLGSNITSVEEQIHYLQRYMHDSTLGRSWRLFGGVYTDPDGSGNDNGTPVHMQPVQISRNKAGTAARAQTRLLFGGSE